MVRVLPDSALDDAILGAVGLEYRCEDAILQPTQVQLWINHLCILLVKHMATDIVSPIAITDIRGGSCKPRQECQRIPSDVDITREACLIAVRAKASPTVIDHWTVVTLLCHMVIEGVVEPECVVQILHILACYPLLPIEPPEVYALLLHRTKHGIEIGIGPLLLRHLVRNALALFAPTISLCKTLVRLLVRLNTRGRVEVQRGLEILLVTPREEVLGRREELLLPGVACPAHTLIILILLRILSTQAPGLVPIHIDDEHIERNIQRAHSLDQVAQLIVRILPIATPPISEYILRRERNIARYTGVVLQRLGIFVSVGKEVQIESIALGTTLNPILPM